MVLSSLRCTFTPVTVKRTTVSLEMQLWNYNLLNLFPLLVENFRISKGWKHLGIPNLISHGSQDINGERHRFLVIPRFGSDIWKIFLKNNRQLPQHTVYRVGIQMVSSFWITYRYFFPGDSRRFILSPLRQNAIIKPRLIHRQLPIRKLETYQRFEGAVHNLFIINPSSRVLKKLNGAPNCEEMERWEYTVSGYELGSYCRGNCSSCNSHWHVVLGCKFTRSVSTKKQMPVVITLKVTGIWN